MTTNDDLNKTLVKFSNNLSFFFRNGLLLLVLFLVSCGREATTQSESKTETKDTLNAKDTALPEKPAFTSTAYGSSLNIETFHFLADSFLTALNGTKVKLKLITDTLPSDTNRRSLIRPLFLPGNARVVRHRFEPENDFSILRIRLLSAF